MSDKDSDPRVELLAQARQILRSIGPNEAEFINILDAANRPNADFRSLLVRASRHPASFILVPQLNRMRRGLPAYG